jgi:hypothetical protein
MEESSSPIVGTAGNTTEAGGHAKRLMLVSVLAGPPVGFAIFLVHKVLSDLWRFGIWPSFGETTSLVFSPETLIITYAVGEIPAALAGLLSMIVLDATSHRLLRAIGFAAAGVLSGVLVNAVLNTIQRSPLLAGAEGLPLLSGASSLACALLFRLLALPRAGGEKV